MHVPIDSTAIPGSSSVTTAIFVTVIFVVALITFGAGMLTGGVCVHCCYAAMARETRAEQDTNLHPLSLRAVTVEESTEQNVVNVVYEDLLPSTMYEDIPPPDHPQPAGPFALTQNAAYEKPTNINT